MAIGKGIAMGKVKKKRKVANRNHQSREREYVCGVWVDKNWIRIDTSPCSLTALTHFDLVAAFQGSACFRLR